MNWLSLKSGSDVRGTACGENITLTEEIAGYLGTAFVRMLSETRQKPAEQIVVALGRDSRISGPALLRAVAEGIVRGGASALDFGLCTTPAMYMSTITPGFEPDGAIMITASHHPWNKNGLKFFTNRGGLEGAQVAELLTRAQALADDGTEYADAQRIGQKPFLAVYMEQLADRIRAGLPESGAKPLQGLHVVVDAGNGAGGFYEQVLKNLGADTSGSQFLDPDGRFPNHIPNPENSDAMNSLQTAVLNARADLGVIFDADCDRAAIVDADGKEINRNRLIALISAVLLEETPGETIVTDSVTSTGLTQFIRLHHGIHYRFKRGYRNVIDEAVRLNNEGISCPLAIETSGHAALKENHFLDDGMYLVTVLIIRAVKMKQEGKSLGSLISDLKEPVEAAELRLDITDPDFQTAGGRTIQRVLDYARDNGKWQVDPENREGIRILFDLDGIQHSGWFLLRLSVHDPVLPLNAESDVPGGIRKMLSELYEVLKNENGICLQALESAINT